MTGMSVGAVREGEPMTPLESLRAAQRDDTTLPSDARLTAYLRSVESGQAALDRAAGMTSEEIRMVGRA